MEEARDKAIESSKCVPCFEPSNCSDEITTPCVSGKEETIRTAESQSRDSKVCSVEQCSESETLFEVTEKSAETGHDFAHGVCLTKRVTQCESEIFTVCVTTVGKHLEGMITKAEGNSNSDREKREERREKRER